MSDFKSIQKFIDDNNEWSIKTFGDCSPIPVLNHLSSEVKEVIEGLVKGDPFPQVELEFADCFILLMQAAKKYDLSFYEIFQAAIYKMKINEGRTWKPQADGTFKHVD